MSTNPKHSVPSPAAAPVDHRGSFSITSHLSPERSTITGLPNHSHGPLMTQRSSASANKTSLISPTSMLGDASSSAASLKPYVFLGGSCDPTVWRREIALPKLDKYKIPYYNPQIDDWHPELIQLEAVAKEDCDVLLFVIDSATRAIASMLEAVEYIMAKRNVVLVILDIPEGTIIDDHPLDERQLKDLNRARAFLCDIAARHQTHCDVFDSIDNAINHIVYSHPSMSPRMNMSLSSSPQSQQR